MDITTTSLLIPIGDLAGKLGVTGEFVMGWGHRLGIELQHDWADRLGVPEPDARKLIAVVEQSGRESAALHQAHQAHLDDWERRQREAGEQAFAAYVQAALEQQRYKAAPDGYAFYGASTTSIRPSVLASTARPSASSGLRGRTRRAIPLASSLSSRMGPAPRPGPRHPTRRHPLRCVERMRFVTSERARPWLPTISEQAARVERWLEESGQNERNRLNRQTHAMRGY
jgi:hypothetical protein